MRVTFLGVGAAFSRRHRNSSLLVEAGEIRLVIDCGRTVPLSLDELGIPPREITHFIITHLHGDHIGGLEEVALMNRIFHQVRPVMLSTGSLLERLWATSLRGGLEFIELSPGDRSSQTLEDYFLPQPAEPGAEIRIGPLRIRLIPTDHVAGLESYAVEIEEDPGGMEHRILFSGDTRFDLELIRRGAASCAHLLHDCQLVDVGPENAIGVHTAWSQLQRVPAAWRSNMLLYHYGDEALPDAAGAGFRGFAQELEPFEV